VGVSAGGGVGVSGTPVNDDDDDDEEEEDKTEAEKKLSRGGGAETFVGKCVTGDEDRETEVETEGWSISKDTLVLDDNVPAALVEASATSGVEPGRESDSDSVLCLFVLCNVILLVDE
jgi:hypothetical protein